MALDFGNEPTNLVYRWLASDTGLFAEAQEFVNGAYRDALTLAELAWVPTHPWHPHAPTEREVVLRQLTINADAREVAADAFKGWLTNELVGFSTNFHTPIVSALVQYALTDVHYYALMLALIERTDLEQERV